MSHDPHNFDESNGRGGSGARIGGRGVTGPWKQNGPPDGGASRRRTGRLPAEALVCNLGLVLDISIGGMRVLSRTPHSGIVKVRFRDYPLPEPLCALVTWSKRGGIFMRELGLRFEALTPQQQEVLTQIASAHRFRRAI